jgi:hypothetical protein
LRVNSKVCRAAGRSCQKLLTGGCFILFRPPEGDVSRLGTPWLKERKAGVRDVGECLLSNSIEISFMLTVVSHKPYRKLQEFHMSKTRMNIDLSNCRFDLMKPRQHQQKPAPTVSRVTSYDVEAAPVIRRGPAGW